MFRNDLVSQKGLYRTGLAATAIFCTILTIVGVQTFFSVAAGQGNTSSQIFNGFTPIRLILNLSYLVSLVVYLVWLTQKTTNLSRFSEVIQVSAPFLLLATLAHPVSSDSYLYLHYGWMVLQGVNPYLEVANSLPSAMSPYFSWTDQTSTYGPLAMGLFMLSAVGILAHPLVAVYLLKLFCLLFHGINGFLIWRLLGQSANRSKLTLAYLVNPAIVSAFIADVHVDVFLCSSILLMLGCLHYYRYTWAVLAAFAGFLTKTLPVIWIPLLLSFLLVRRRWKELGVAIGSILLVGLFLSQSILPDRSAWSGLLNPSTAELTARSFHHILVIGLEKFVGITPEQRSAIVQGLKLAGYSIFFGAYFVCLGNLFFSHRYTEDELTRDIGWTALILLVFATPWLMPWYSSILFPIALLLTVKAPRFTVAALIFGLSPTLIYGTGSGQNLLGMATAFLSVVPASLAILFGEQLFPYSGLAAPTRTPEPVNVMAGKSTL